LSAVKFALAALLVGLVAASARPVNRSNKVTVRATKPAPSYDVAAINDPQNQAIVSQDRAGSAAVRAQVLLDRAHFSPGEIDGRWGDNLRVAIIGYQMARMLNPSGVVDPDTWQSLNADTAQALTPYTITPDDIAGPFDKIPREMMAQAKLKSLGYQSAQEKLAERFHISPALLARLNPGKSLSKIGEEIVAPNVAREYAVPADKVVVSKNNRTVSAVRADGTLLAQYPATMGSEHDPLPVGDWKITEVDHYPWFHYNPDLFWDAKPRDAKAKIPPGPNNPVGVAWIGLSKEHYGIHGSPEPSRIGHTESHGCIRLTNWDAEELSKMVKVGTPAILQE
jgi:lipoprotein-anchoring transpeptidase ErfK/SrfK